MVHKMRLTCVSEPASHRDSFKASRHVIETFKVTEQGAIQYASHSPMGEVGDWRCGICGGPAAFAYDLTTALELEYATRGGK